MVMGDKKKDGLGITGQSIEHVRVYCKGTNNQERQQRVWFNQLVMLPRLVKHLFIWSPNQSSNQSPNDSLRTYCP